MRRKITQNTPYGVVTATWEHVDGGMIEVRYGENVKRAVAGSSEASNDFIAGDVLRKMIADDLAKPDD